MTERSANDTTTPARLVLDAYIIDPVTKLPMAPGVASGGATEAEQQAQTDLLGDISAKLDAATAIDQTTPGTTNGVVMKDSGGAEIDFADPTTGTLSQVASSATAVTILAANTSRKGAAIFNDSTQVLYLGLSNTTPTSSAYTVKMAAASYFEVPAGYNGIIKGIWASANGNAVITELT